jgi:glycosyltransferase involved in cell wall biosynthesis
MRALILCAVPGVHEERFAAALRQAGIDVRVSGIEGELTVRRLIREVRPDVLQIGPLPLAAGVVGAVPRSLPLVVVSYGWDAQLADRDGWDALAPALARCDAAICDCAATEVALRDLCRPETPIARFPWGVDLQMFDPRGPARDIRSPVGWASGDGVLLATRRLEPLYDPLVLVDGLAGAATERLRLLFLGEGSLEHQVLARARQRGCADRVAIVPPVVESELPAMMRAADVWVNAARADGASISLLQALACGKPVVTPDLVCARDWVDETVGALFPVADPGAAAIAMDRVMQLRLEMGPRCRRRAEERADWRVHAETYRRLVLRAAGRAT